MNELKDIVERLNGWGEKDRYVVVCATHDDESGTWSLRVRHEADSGAQGAEHEGD